MRLSILQALNRQNLIAQKSNLQYSMLQNSAMQRDLMNQPFFGYENNLQMQATNDSIQLMAINAELQALNNYNINYMA